MFMSDVVTIQFLIILIQRQLFLSRYHPKFGRYNFCSGIFYENDCLETETPRTIFIKLQ